MPHLLTVALIGLLVTFMALFARRLFLARKAGIPRAAVLVASTKQVVLIALSLMAVVAFFAAWEGADSILVNLLE